MIFTSPLVYTHTSGFHQSTAKTISSLFERGERTLETILKESYLALRDYQWLFCENEQSYCLQLTSRTVNTIFLSQAFLTLIYKDRELVFWLHNLSTLRMLFRTFNLGDQEFWIETIYDFIFNRLLFLASQINETPKNAERVKDNMKRDTEVFDIGLSVAKIVSMGYLNPNQPRCFDNQKGTIMPFPDVADIDRKGYEYLIFFTSLQNSQYSANLAKMIVNEIGKAWSRQFNEQWIPSRQPRACKLLLLDLLSLLLDKENDIDASFLFLFNEAKKNPAQSSKISFPKDFFTRIHLMTANIIPHLFHTKLWITCRYRNQLRSFRVWRSITFSAFLSFLKYVFEITSESYYSLYYCHHMNGSIQIKSQSDLDQAFLGYEENDIICFHLSTDEVLLSKSLSQMNQNLNFDRIEERTLNATETSEPVIPKRLSANFNFVYGKIIGRGAHSLVRSALNLDTGEMLAIKQIKLPGTSKEATKCLKSLQKEIEILQQLNHPNIIRYLGINQDGDCLNILLELISGGTLQTAIKKHGPFDEVLIKHYTHQICLGLKYLHDHDIVHRDIKSANILLGTHGSAKLADFGTAIRLLDHKTTKELCGTPYWMAPEVIRQEIYGKSADVWSLACTIIEMATQYPPWHRFTEHAAAMYHIATTTETPSIPTWLSRDAQCLLYCCFERDPAKRPTMDDILNHPFLREDIDSKSLEQKYHLQYRLNFWSQNDENEYLNKAESATIHLETIYSNHEFAFNGSDSLFQRDLLEPRSIFV
jgi:serine/threonine protein kinase